MKKTRIIETLKGLRAYGCDACPIYFEGCAGKFETAENECYYLFMAYLNGEHPFEEASDEQD